jgi:hypothetical protein
MSELFWMGLVVVLVFILLNGIRDTRKWSKEDWKENGEAKKAIKEQLKDEEKKNK